MKSEKEINEMIDRLADEIDNGGSYEHFNSYKESLEWVLDALDEDLITGQ